MGRLGCTAVGTLDDSKFNEPMPWIGAYVASASAACALAMAADAAHALRYRKLWFPSRFFSLNATTLTLIGVAVKLSVDLNTSMPRPHDQLSKLSSTAFLSTAIANSLPSLGSSSSSSDLMMNILALSILVITVLVNVAIQLATGVIYVFLPEHILIISLTLILLGITISSALAVPATKCYFELKYAKKYELAKTECCGSDLKDNLARYWMMAHTCSPQFVVGRMATCTASGAYCLLSALTLAEAVLRSYFMPWCFTFCKGRSDYKWSVFLVLVTQAAAVLVGTIGPASRWFFAIKFRCPKRRKNSSEAKFSVENYWVQTLKQLKECPLDLRICSRHGKKFVHHVKNKALDLCILVQKVIVISSKFLRMLSIIIMSRLIAALSCCKRLVSLFRCNVKCAETESSDPNKSNSKLDLSRYVMHLEGEENLVHVMMESDRDATGHFLKMGRKKQPKHLIHIIEKLEPSKGFGGVYAFDSKFIPPLDPTMAEPPKSWALPVVTLTSIAVATSTDSDFNSVRELIKCMNEGLKYIRVVENSLDVKRTSTNVRKAAEIVWVGVELHYRWLDVDLRETRLRGKSPKHVISELSKIAKQKFVELRKKDPIGCLRYDPARWPVKALAANAMYRVCETLLLDKSNECEKSVFERLSAMIGDIIGACLTNLERAISVKCHQSSIEHREESVRHAILLLGKTERIFEIIGRQRVPSSDPEKLACINKWREMGISGNDRLSCGSTPTSSDFSVASDLYLNVD